MTTRSIRLGATGPSVFPIALGCMGMSGVYGPTRDDEGIATIHRAIERGVTLIDTGDFYGMGHNEWLIRRAIEGKRDKVQLSVKFGAQRGPDGAWHGFDARPAAVKTFVAYSLQRLGVETIDIYRPARLDPKVPIEETVGAIADLIKAGYVRHIGLSEVGVETIRRAHAVHPIVDLQIEYAIATRNAERAIFPALHALGICATLYGVFSRGLLTGSTPTGPRDWRNFAPRFSTDHASTNALAVAKLKALAGDRGLTPAQLSLAWVLAKEPTFVPTIGARTPVQLDDALVALDKPLSPTDVAQIEVELPATLFSGERYASEQMRHLDSERA